ncbi:hypothetical protein GWK47_033715 [Chionoecetes opilio]|uniref:Uncharacterized protein n=1 Tax=Chionoecetes opilio TaxID=41210 RepID=A0A8J5D3W7_CHIOP|nr:hypothetical protein GWK47_033715 [Chionoecetes opilio]
MCGKRSPDHWYASGCCPSCRPCFVPVPDPAPSTCTDDVDDPSAGGGGHHPAITCCAEGEAGESLLCCKNPHIHTTRNPASKSRNCREGAPQPAGVMDVVEDTELQYGAPPWDVMAKDVWGGTAGRVQYPLNDGTDGSPHGSELPMRRSSPSLVRTSR